MVYIVGLIDVFSFPLQIPLLPTDLTQERKERKMCPLSSLSLLRSQRLVSPINDIIPSGSRRSSSALPTSGRGAGGPGIWLQCSIKAKRFFENTNTVANAQTTAM